ncbi:hypothetical protein NQ318_011187 [Aromia moschata]|uniref:Uncharacterized protein n=1 Tax=Aromia moschata TaxID=1265417 RepID=A0AAV8YIS3_9CUCU|nr:hypothetical protein NQ318_011187 [Aromia moschata]
MTDLSGYVGVKKQAVLFYLFSDGWPPKCMDSRRGKWNRVCDRLQCRSVSTKIKKTKDCSQDQRIKLQKFFRTMRA